MLVIAVDNEYLSLSGLKSAIKKSMPVGAKVKGFRNSPDALQYASEYLVDVAFLDMEMPRMHGLILAKELQRLNPSINLVFVSSTDHYTSAALKMHASGYLTKPIRQELMAQEFANLRYPIVTEGISHLIAQKML